MHLEIAGRRALACASSKGLGRACAAALAAEGVHVTVTGDATPRRWRATVAELSAAYPQVDISQAVGDIATAQGRAPRSGRLP